MEPRDAATVMLVRDAPDLQVFMLRRNLRSVFVGGAYVFPGGAVDPEDRSPELAVRTAGLADVDVEAAGFRVAAIRESFEEAGVLLARHAVSGAPVAIDAPGTAEALDVARRAMIAGERTLLDVVAEHDLVLDAGALRVFARWITPPGAPRRYDTWFFVAPAPEGHAYVHDDDETVASTWVRPADALEAARRREIELIYPTFRSLQALERFPTADAVLEAVARAWRDEPDPFRVLNPGQAWQVRLPGDDPVDVADLDALAHATTVARPRAGGA